MKKLLVAGIILGMTTLFSGCTKISSIKSMEKAIILMQNKEYDEAIIFLKDTLNKDKTNKEAIKLYDIVDSYQAAAKAVEENNIEKANNFIKRTFQQWKIHTVKKLTELTERKT